MYGIDNSPVLEPETAPEETLVEDNAEANTDSPVEDNVEEIESSPKPTGDEIWKQRQSQLDKEKAAFQKQQAEFEAQKKAFEESQKPKQPEIVKPVRPVKPEGYDKFDAINDLDSPSAKYDELEREYLVKNDEYRDYLTSQLMQEREQERQAAIEKAEQEKARQYHLGELVTAGCDPQKATKVLEFMTSQESIDYKNVIAYYDMIKGQPKQTKTTVPNIPPVPGAVITGGERVYDEGDSYTLQEEEKRKKFIL